jgi:hypothetical protein
MAPLKIVLVVVLVLVLGLYLPKKTEDEHDDEDETFSSNVAQQRGMKNSYEIEPCSADQPFLAGQRQFGGGPKFL